MPEVAFETSLLPLLPPFDELDGLKRMGERGGKEVGWERGEG
jgi:hypothetical protein